MKDLIFLTALLLAVATNNVNAQQPGSHNSDTELSVSVFEVDEFDLKIFGGKLLEHRQMIETPLIKLLMGWQKPTNGFEEHLLEDAKALIKGHKNKWLWQYYDREVSALLCNLKQLEDAAFTQLGKNVADKDRVELFLSGASRKFKKSPIYRALTAPPAVSSGQLKREQVAAIGIITAANTFRGLEEILLTQLTLMLP